MRVPKREYIYSFYDKVDGSELPVTIWLKSMREAKKRVPKELDEWYWYNGVTKGKGIFRYKLFNGILSYLHLKAIRIYRSTKTQNK